MTKPLHDERLRHAELAAQGFTVTPDIAATLREIAQRGDDLRRRYVNACNYAWATTEAYERRTEEAELALVGLAQSIGLHIHLQTDPRGACVYVSAQPIPRNSYSSCAVCIYPQER